MTERTGGWHLPVSKKNRGGRRSDVYLLTDMGHLFTSALEVEEISGIILNPWNRTLMLNKKLINIILGNC